MKTMLQLVSKWLASADRTPEDIDTWIPCIDTLYRDYLKSSIKQVQTKLDETVKEFSAFNKAYDEFVNYKEYQSKVTLRSKTRNG